MPEREPIWHPALLRLDLLAKARLLFGWQARQLGSVSNADLFVHIATELAVRSGKGVPQ